MKNRYFKQKMIIKVKKEKINIRNTCVDFHSHKDGIVNGLTSCKNISLYNNELSKKYKESSDKDYMMIRTQSSKESTNVNFSLREFSELSEYNHQLFRIVSLWKNISQHRPGDNISNILTLV